MIFMAILPIGFALFSLLVFFIMNLISPKNVGSNYIRNWIATNVVFIFLLYPGITSSVFGMFSCMKIEEKYYLINDMGTVCWDDDHMSVLMRFTIPSAIIWVFGFPIVIFIILYRHRKDLSNKNFLIKFGVFFIGFNDEQFFW